MFRENPKCGKEIKGDEVVFVKIRYPKNKGMTEIKTYLKNEGSFICEACFDK
jgi:hypothetical protein